MQTRAGHPTQIHLVIGKARAQTTHGVRRANDNRIAEVRCGGQTFVHRVRNRAARGLATTALDDALEQVPVLAELDCLEAGADERAAVLLEDASLVQEDGRCLLYTSPSPRDGLLSRMPSSA